MKRLQASLMVVELIQSLCCMFVSKCWFINASALAGALREHNADEENRVICIIIINIIMLLNVLMVNTAVVEMGVHNSRDEEQRHIISVYRSS